MRTPEFVSLLVLPRLNYVFGTKLGLECCARRRVAKAGANVNGLLGIRYLISSPAVIRHSQGLLLHVGRNNTLPYISR